MFAFTFMNYFPELLDVAMPLNESRSRILLHQTKYFANQKYFYIVMIHENIGIFLSLTTGIAAESFSLINALHAFGMFKIARYIVSEKRFLLKSFSLLLFIFISFKLKIHRYFPFD